MPPPARQIAAAVCPCLRHVWIARTASSDSLSVDQERASEGVRAKSRRECLVTVATISTLIVVH